LTPADLETTAAAAGEDLLDAVIVATGPEPYRPRDGVAFVMAALLGP